MLNSEFNRNVFTLVSGTTIAQIISLLSALVLSRLYTPNDFGIFTLFMSIVSVIALLLSGRYELAINLPKTDEEAINVFGLSLKLSFIITLVLFLLSIISFFVINYFIKSSIIFIKWIIFIPIFSLLLNASNIFQNWFIRKKNFKIISVSKIVNSVSNNGIAIILGLLTIGVWGIFLGNLIGLILSVIILLVIFYRNDKQILQKINKNQMQTLAKRYADLPKANSFQSLIDAFQIQGITYLMALFFTNSIIGYYAFTLRLLQAPVGLIISSITQVFYQKASEMYNHGENISILINNTIKKSLLIASPLIVLVVIFGPNIFVFVFGEQWREAGIYARILAPWIFLDFIRIPISQVPIILGKQKKQLFLSLLSNLIIILSMLAAGLIFNEIRIGLIFISVFQSIYTVGIVFWIYKISSKSVLQIIK